MPDSQFVELCGEGEWYVGSRGGAGDHAAIRCSKPGKIVHLNFKPFSIGTSVKFPESCSVIVANSLEQSKKSEGSKDKFNARVAAYEFAFMLIKRLFPEKTLLEFRDLATTIPPKELKHIISLIPAKVTRSQILELLPESHAIINQIFSTHADPGEYDLYGTSLYGVSEIIRAAKAPEILANGDFALDENGTLYLVRDVYPLSGNLPGNATSLQVAKANVAILNNFVSYSWEIVETFTTSMTVDYEDEESMGWDEIYSGSFVRDPYGYISTLDGEIEYYYSTADEPEELEDETYKFSANIAYRKLSV